MPEETEFKALMEEFEGELKEQKEEAQKSDGLLKLISFTTAIIAVIAAIATLESGSTINSALNKKNDAAIATTLASDRWAYYQAKGIKAIVLESQVSLLTSLNKPIPTNTKKAIEKYKQEQKDISVKAKEFEHKSEQLSQESEKLIEQHHTFAYAVAILQISVALSAISAISKNRNIWYLSILIAVAGTMLSVNGLFLSHSERKANSVQLIYKA